MGALQELLNEHSFWAQGRSQQQLSRMLFGSQAVVSAWDRGVLVGFGRATSDGVFRAVLWDVVVASSFQGQGVGRCLVRELLHCGPLAQVERIYLMTTNCEVFYQKLGFVRIGSQRALLLENKKQLNTG
jgi:N-acetylglutamate synthase-like GNAT family acetyltransferase